MEIQRKTGQKIVDIFPDSSYISVQRSVKWHQKWFTKGWPIIKTLEETMKFVASTGLYVNKLIIKLTISYG